MKCDYKNCENPISEESKKYDNDTVKLCDKHEKEFVDLLPENPEDVNVFEMVGFMLETNLANRK